MKLLIFCLNKNTEILIITQATFGFPYDFLAGIPAV
jgi:hypothetical protein